MNKAAMLAILFTACAGSIRPKSVECQNNYSDARDMVYEAWLDVGVETPTCYSLEFLDKDELFKECQGHVSDGCSYNISQRVYVGSHLNSERQMVVLYHEVGHLAAVKPGHLTCSIKPGDDIMCEAGASDGTVPTLRDAAFVKGLLSE